ncbi:MAG TPA: PstS family phosphate ABC transporter substrate-binding protein [Thermoanaerobaculia bacterium]|nr:PstS family phosphate ABC transporter substrate-binding protein [Thermoanaerobaculia bacterium]
MRSRFLSLLLVISLLFAPACGKKEDSEAVAPGGETSATGPVTVDGSSTVFPITEAVAEEFQRENRKVRVTVGISGTGGGFKKFCGGETDITNASRPIKPTEVELCAANGIEYVELPVAFDGIAIIVNRQNDWAGSITAEELKRLFEAEAQRRIMRWSQVRAGWPDREIHLYAPGVDSGTYDYFSEAIIHRAQGTRGDYTSSEDDNVIVQGVATDPLALGFFGFAYYAENTDKLKVLGVDDGNPANGEGPILPSVETIRNGTYQPLSRPILIYVAARSLDKPQVAAFVRFYLENAQGLIEEVGYVPLPDEAYKLASERVTARRTGSLFGGTGSQVGVSIEDLMRQSAQGR